MLILYDNDFSTCAQKVRLLLNEKQLEWETVWLDLRAGDQHDPEYLTLNPNGVVPTIVDEGKPIIESTLILQYLEEKFLTNPSFYPSGASDRYGIRLLQNRIDTALHADIAVLSISVAFRHELIARKGDLVADHIEKIPNPVMQGIWRGAIEEGLRSRPFVNSLRNWRDAVQQLENHLQIGGWLVGDKYSIADMSYVPYIVRLDHLGLLQYLVDDCPGVVKWISSIQQRPAYAAAFTNVIDKQKIEFLQQCARNEAVAIETALASL
ncbi:MAG: glutathione S-transferase family protein [Pseudomonadota bacterium]